MSPGKIGFLRNFQYNPKLSPNTVSLDYFIGEWDFAPTEQNPIPLLSRYRLPEGPLCQI